MCVSERGRGGEAASTSAYRSTSEAGHTQACWEGRTDGCMVEWDGRRDSMEQRDGRIGDHGFCGSVGVSVFLSPPLNTNESTQAQVGHDWDDWELTTGRTTGQTGKRVSG